MSAMPPHLFFFLKQLLHMCTWNLNMIRTTSCLDSSESLHCSNFPSYDSLLKTRLNIRRQRPKGSPGVLRSNEASLSCSHLLCHLTSLLLLLCLPMIRFNSAVTSNTSFFCRIEALPTVKKYMESPSYMKKGPFNNKIALWGPKALE